MNIKFEWDTGNYPKSFVKHGVDKGEAESCFSDPNYLNVGESYMRKNELRFNALALSNLNRILYLVYTFRGTDERRIRIISARQASREEREVYKDQ